jgi:metal iron transporter
MNCPSRTDEPEGTGFNQNPNALAADLTTRQDLNGRANSRVLRRIASSEVQIVVEDESGDSRERNGEKMGEIVERMVTRTGLSHVGRPLETLEVSERNGTGGRISPVGKYLMGASNVMKKFGKFVGPGFMVSI